MADVCLFLQQSIEYKKQVERIQERKQTKNYTKARQMHYQGKAYQETIRNLFFLEDDLNNDTLQFYIALERFNITSGILYKAESNLKSRYSARSTYQIDKYFNKLTEQR